jgi:NAD(P)-dependent dehydrogenase (short-subunit alcohol dehydrogenase family)
MRMHGKTALITGGGSGIGAATARRLAAEGAKVAVLDLNGVGAKAVAAETGGLGFDCDVTSDEQVNRAIAEVAASIGPIHVLFNNAGTAVRSPVHEHSEIDWDRIVAVNLKGAFLCSKHAIAHFAPEGGSIIHASSVTGITGVRSRAAYSAAKGALVALARNMALDYAARRIRVNCVCPGFVRTPLIGPLLADPERTAHLVAMHPLGRLGEPEDVANAVLFLASEESSWMTGQCLIVDGGFSAGQANEI